MKEVDWFIYTPIIYYLLVHLVSNYNKEDMHMYVVDQFKPTMLTSPDLDLKFTELDTIEEVELRVLMERTRGHEVIVAMEDHFLADRVCELLSIESRTTEAPTFPTDTDIDQYLLYVQAQGDELVWWLITSEGTGYLS
jgi:hypothetical protein